MKSINIDNVEVNRYAAMADQWWDRNGEFKPLHDINPVRVEYILGRADLKAKSLLDVGCGGGLLAEAMAAAGACVTGIDMATSALNTAKAHMKQSGLKIDYQEDTAENFARHHQGRFDVVICMELVEHVPDPASILKACAGMLQPGGHFFLATINRTWIARLLIILISEYVLGIVRKGTHTYKRFVRPQEMEKWGRMAGLTLADLSGLRYIPFVGYAALCRNTSMNYIIHFIKTG